MQNAIRTIYIQNYISFLLRIDFVNTALGPSGSVVPCFCFNLYVSP